MRKGNGENETERLRQSGLVCLVPRTGSYTEEGVPREWMKGVRNEFSGGNSWSAEKSIAEERQTVAHGFNVALNNPRCDAMIHRHQLI